MLSKSLFLLTSLIIISPPYLDFNKIFLIILVFSLLLLSKVKKINFNIIINKKLLIIFFLLSIFINQIIPKTEIKEAHSIFLNKNDISVISNFLPNKIILEINKKMVNFDSERLLKSMHKKYIYEDIQTIKVPFAFSSDSFFQNQILSRNNKSINFKTREDLRIGQLNTFRYNFPHDKHFRRMLPYYVYFEIPNLYKNSKICSKGILFKSNSTKEKLNPSDIKNMEFQKNYENCFYLKNNFKTFHLVGFSINDNDNLSIQLKDNVKVKIYKLLKFISIISSILLLFFIFFKIKINENIFIYLTSVFATIVLALIRDFNLITGLRYVRGGADGIKYNTYAQTILENLYLGNILEALNGGTAVFYFMPGWRYILSFGKMFFGDTNYFYLIIASFLPLVVFLLIKKLTNIKYAYVLSASFIFFPIFENMGFGYFNYIWQVARNHVETASILFILTSILLILDVKKNIKKKINKIKISNIIFISLLLSFAALCRPNFVLSSAILFIYLNYILLKNKNLFYIFLSCLFYSTIFLALLHNFYFGGVFILFTSSAIHFDINFIEFFIGFFEIIKINFENDFAAHIIYQFRDWNPLYNIHRLIMIFIIVYYIFTKRNNSISYIIFLCLSSQHALLIATHASSRYAYLAWILTFILFIQLNFKFNILKKILENYKKLYHKILHAKN